MVPRGARAPGRSAHPSSWPTIVGSGPCHNRARYKGQSRSTPVLRGGVPTRNLGQRGHSSGARSPSLSLKVVVPRDHPVHTRWNSLAETASSGSLSRGDRLVCQVAVLVLQVPPAIPVELAGRGQLGLLDDGQLAAVGRGLDVLQATLLVGVAEAVSQGGFLIDCSEVRHGLCLDALQVNRGLIVRASELLRLTSTSDIDDAGRQYSWAIRHGRCDRGVPRQYQGTIELVRR